MAEKAKELQQVQKSTTASLKELTITINMFLPEIT